MTGACPMCSGATAEVAHFDAPPSGEPDYGLSPYRRGLWQCERCGHLVNRHDMDLSRLYEGAYREVAYAGALKERFQRIMALPPERSDNRGRARWVDKFAASCGLAGRRLLDVGSGLAVFPAAMRELGWQVTALDPDPVNAAHAREAAGVETVVGDFRTATVDRRYDLITFNRVLEHVLDPAALLERARGLLMPGGVVYVELPDGEAALAEGTAREEFFVDHHHVFSFASCALLARSTSFVALLQERLREPSGKFTLRGVVRPGR